MMLQHLGETQASQAVEKALEAVLAHPEFHTPDLGGRANTGEVGSAVAHQITAEAAG
jgi:tartrate dehydrogenase/decarboxylase / D-malate dehydrogenase